MNGRKRINISVDTRTYEVLKSMKETYGFSSLCEMIVALLHILLDRTSNHRQYDIPEDDGEYIDQMFNDLSHTERTPDGNPPKRHNNHSSHGKG